ncbi:uncharacterized protein F5891DRAFT_1013676 [Suillus fuscotomentosus]|uniref:F-box domain-containing protein n=1 Tax=Suillus fuscotomentosus TaxID=1912939 RepID=A0AAD4EFW8_9AGAM|nr:uncharacterized protein F5891DRAFT_1013676 [Suillus fuscotomentosus]KAG1904264.1 hypothetical protein F5891DRAFT_1013676 [Suillus fuscotomentosus]
MWRDYGDYDNDSGTDPDLTDLDTGSDSSSQCSEHGNLSEAPGEEAVGDYGGETYIPDKRHVAKRVRTGRGTDIGTALAVKRSGRGKKSLSLIVTVPIDILLEICSFLEPVDLLHLFHAHKAFHKVLSSNHAVSVWKAARVNRGGVPDCMPGMSEAEWADLLFGGSDCYECGKKRVWDIDFGIRRRVCQPCLNENLVCKSAFPFAFPEYDLIILDLIPFSSIGAEDHDHDYIVDLGCKLFWSDDIDKMAEELEVYLKPGAEQALEDFKQSRKKYVDSDSNHIAVCDASVANDCTQQSLCVDELRSQNTKLFQARLVYLGHDAEDVERMFDNHHYGVLDKEFTDARWKRLIPKVECKLAQLQEEWRLERQRKVSSIRESELLTMYQKYVWPLPQGITPSSEDFLELCDVAEFIKSPPTADTGSDAFAEKIPDFCADYMHKKKLELTRLLALSTDAVQDTTTPQSQGIDAPDDMLLQLATSVFQCTYPQSFPLITWDKVQHHGRSSHSQRPRSSYAMMSTSPCTFSVSQRGVAAARSLLSLVGLDAQTTTATTMDDLQCRFFCSNCSPKPENGGSYRMAMNWRQGVFHYVEDQSPSHEEPRWELLSTAQLHVIQSSPAPEYPTAARQVWRCNKYNVYHRDSTTKAKVIKHMRSHGITTPTEGIDFSYDQGVIEKPPPATKFFITPQIKKPSKPSTTQKSKPSTKSVYRCQHCNGLDRTFLLEGVKQHIKVKHDIKSPHEGPDFYKVK